LQELYSEVPDLPWDHAFLGVEQSSVFPAESSLQSKDREGPHMTGGRSGLTGGKCGLIGRRGGQTITVNCLTCQKSIPSGPARKNVKCATYKTPKSLARLRGASSAKIAQTQCDKREAARAKETMEILSDCILRQKAETEAENERLKTKVSEMDGKIREQDGQIREHGGQIRETDDQIRRRDSEIEQLRARLQESEQQQSNEKVTEGSITQVD
jgi:hypothetical protein